MKNEALILEALAEILSNQLVAMFDPRTKDIVRRLDEARIEMGWQKALTPPIP